MRHRPSFLDAPSVAALLITVAAAAEARAAVVLERSMMESARGFDGLISDNLVVGTALDQMLVVGIAIAHDRIEATSVLWRDVPLIRVGGADFASGQLACRIELWRLLNPPPGNHRLRVSLSGTSAFGIGMVVYSGVDQQSPTGPMSWTVGGNADLVTGAAALNGHPVLGLACLGGGWETGPGPMAPATFAGSGDTALWDFTEPGVVGLGSQRLAEDGRASVRWKATAPRDFIWIAASLAIRPAGEAPDGGWPDAGPEDASAPVDAAPEAGADAEPDLDAGGDTTVDGEAVPDGADAPIDEDAVSFRQVNLAVGCDCRTGRAGSPPAIWLLAIVLLPRLVKRRRSTRPPGSES